MDPMTGLFLVSTGLQMYGNYEASKSKASLLREEAAMDRMEAEEIMQRNAINNELLFGEAKKFQGKQLASMAAAGGGMSASRLQILMDTATLAAEQAKRDTREAEWEARMKGISAASKEKSAKATEEAGVLDIFTTGLSSGFSLARAKGL